MTSLFLLFEVFYQCFDPVIVESHSIDQGVVRDESKQTWLWVAGLGFGSNSANFNKAKAKVCQYVNPFTIFIETSCQANIIGQLQAIDPLGCLWVGGCKK